MGKIKSTPDKQQAIVDEAALHLDTVLARGFTDDGDAVADLVDEGGRDAHELDHRLHLGAEAVEVDEPSNGFRRPAQDPTKRSLAAAPTL